MERECFKGLDNSDKFQVRCLSEPHLNFKPAEVSATIHLPFSQRGPLLLLRWAGCSILQSLDARKKITGELGHIFNIDSLEFCWYKQYGVLCLNTSFPFLGPFHLVNALPSEYLSHSS